MHVLHVAHVPRGEVRVEVLVVAQCVETKFDMSFTRTVSQSVMGPNSASAAAIGAPRGNRLSKTDRAGDGREQWALFDLQRVVVIMRRKREEEVR